MSAKYNGPKWKLVWAPEGKTIAEGVEARTARAAKKQAPMPYRRYSGEIYAELENHNAYVGIVTLESEGFLLGGGLRHESTPFESNKDAWAWTQAVMETNKTRPGREFDIITRDVRAVWAREGTYIKKLEAQ
jgi:hypothetical protein